VVATAPDERVAHVATAAVRPRAQGHLSMVRPEVGHGRVVVLDARPARAPAAAALRLVALDGPFAPGRHPPRRVLGTVPLAPDGSVFGHVPADTPLLVEVLDAEGTVVEASRSPFWVRPNETRGCIGCHEPRDRAPPNVRPAAVLADPVSFLDDGEAGS
jgi:hypothetical protein